MFKEQVEDIIDMVKRNPEAALSTIKDATTPGLYLTTVWDSI